MKLVIAEKKIQESFSQTGDFLEPALMPGIGYRQVQKLQRPSESQSAVFGMVLVAPIEGSLDFATDIGQLFHKGKHLPATGRE